MHEANLDLLAALGIVAPTGGRVSPGAPASRELMAEWLVRTYEYTSGSAPSGRPRRLHRRRGVALPVEHQQAAAVGFTGGVTPTTFEPARSLPRNQMATFVARILDKLVEDGSAMPPSSGPEVLSTGSAPPPSPGSGPAGSPPPLPELSVGAGSVDSGLE